MIKHLVCWKIKEYAEGLEKKEILEKMKIELLSLKSKLPMLKSLEVGINSADADKGNFDIVLETKFNSISDLNDYQVHPEHKKVADFIGKVRESRACVDYEI